MLQPKTAKWGKQTANTTYDAAKIKIIFSKVKKFDATKSLSESYILTVLQISGFQSSNCIFSLKRKRETMILHNFVVRLVTAKVYEHKWFLYV